MDPLPAELEDLIAQWPDPNPDKSTTIALEQTSQIAVILHYLSAQHARCAAPSTSH